MGVGWEGLNLRRAPGALLDLGQFCRFSAAFALRPGVLETPDVTGPVSLVKPEAVFLFADPDLESMTAAQKILLRMGGANAALVKEKLLELGAKLSL